MSSSSEESEGGHAPGPVLEGGPEDEGEGDAGPDMGGESPEPGPSGVSTMMIKQEMKEEIIGKKWYQQAFRREWLDDPRFKPWLEMHPTDKFKARCNVCHMDLKSANKTGLLRHKKAVKHLRNLQSSQTGIVITYPGQGMTKEVLVVPVQQEGGSSPSASAKELIIPASVGFIGAGNMAQALMNAFLAKGLVEPHLLMASAPTNRNLDKLPGGIRTTNNNNRLVKECDIIFLCVKPHLLTEMIEGLDPLEREHNPLFISVVTGHDISTLEQLLGSLVDAPRVVRTMPNTPCMIGLGCCVYTMGSNTNESDNKVVYSMLHSVGFCAEVPEDQIDAACGLAGSGPAYIYAAIEALADGGVKMGLPRHLSQTLAAHTVKGAAAMVLQTGKHPGQLKDDVCSPSGTTITAMHTLEKNGFRNALMSAVEASANRSKELGEHQ